MLHGPNNWPCQPQLLSHTTQADHTNHQVRLISNWSVLMWKEVADIINHNCGLFRCFRVFLMLIVLIKLQRCLLSLEKKDDTYKIVQRPREERLLSQSVLKTSFTEGQQGLCAFCVLYKLCLCCRQTAVCATVQFSWCYCCCASCNIKKVCYNMRTYRCVQT